MASFAIIGTGAWGLAMAVHLHRLGHAVALLGLRESTADELAVSRQRPQLLPGVVLPDEILVVPLYVSLSTLLDADHWFFAVPTRYLRDALTTIQNQIAWPKLGMVSLVKGVENGTFARPTEMIAEFDDVYPLAVLSGPSHAEEVVAGKPTSVLIASANAHYAETLQGLIGSERFRVYASDDPLGVELAGAIKNVLAIAAGVGDGLGFGDNAKAALLARGVVEMTRFGVACGAKPETFAGLAGLGDLMATCFSPHGRNRRAGESIARGMSIEEILAGPQVVEGYYTARSIHEKAMLMNLDLPIVRSVYELLYEGKPPAQAVKDLMARKQKREQW